MIEESDRVRLRERLIAAEQGAKTLRERLVGVKNDLAAANAECLSPRRSDLAH